MIDLLLPRTDAGAFVQAVVAVVVFGTSLAAVRRSREMLWFVSGLATITFAWFALRTVH